ncbi:MAG: gfo/Idh/MocA family oxidoreductase, partial [Verrucomicrobiota bacterium]
GSLADGIAIRELAKRHGTPWFTSSALRFSPGILSFRGEHEKVGKVNGCEAWSPCSTEAHHPDLFWYGIHGCETLFTIMGPGIESVVRSHTPSTDLVVGTWKDGRIGTFRGLRGPGKAAFGATVYGTKGIAPAGSFAGYQPLVIEIAKFFLTGKAPVDPDESIEILAFMEAADESKRRGGQPVKISEVMKTAGEQAKSRLKDFE